MGLNYPIKELNERPKREPAYDGVVIEYNQEQMLYQVRFPRRGRLGSTTLLEASGGIANIGPDETGPGRWRTVEAALAYWNKVDENFRRLL